LSQWTEAELAYFAGIIDGEGCISLCTSKKNVNNRYGTQVFIGNTDERLIQWIHSRFGGTLGFRKRLKPNQKDLWTVNFSGVTVEPILAAVLPYLVLKREQAALMLEFRKTVREVGANTANSPAAIEQRAAIRDQMQVLNYRGIRT
jgi:hypothetical protein